MIFGIIGAACLYLISVGVVFLLTRRYHVKKTDKTMTEFALFTAFKHAMELQSVKRQYQPDGEKIFSNLVDFGGPTDSITITKYQCAKCGKIFDEIPEYHICTGDNYGR